MICLQIVTGDEDVVLRADFVEGNSGRVIWRGRAAKNLGMTTEEFSLSGSKLVELLLAPIESAFPEVLTKPRSDE